MFSLFIEYFLRRHSKFTIKNVFLIHVMVFHLNYSEIGAILRYGSPPKLKAAPIREVLLYKKIYGVIYYSLGII